LIIVNGEKISSWKAYQEFVAKRGAFQKAIHLLDKCRERTSEARAVKMAAIRTLIEEKKRVQRENQVEKEREKEKEKEMQMENQMEMQMEMEMEMENQMETQNPHKQAAVILGRVNRKDDMIKLMENVGYTLKKKKITPKSLVIAEKATLDKRTAGIRKALNMKVI